MADKNVCIEVLVVNSRQSDRREWLPLPGNRAAVQALFDRLGITLGGGGLTADYSIAKARNLPFPELEAAAGQPGTIDAWNWLAAAFGRLGPGDLAMAAAVAKADHLCQISDFLCLACHTDAYCLIPEAGNEQELGEYHLYHSGLISMPPEWKEAVDPAVLGGLIACKEQGRFLPQGYLMKFAHAPVTVCDLSAIPAEYQIEPKAAARDNQEKEA